MRSTRGSRRWVLAAIVLLSGLPSTGAATPVEQGPCPSGTMPLFAAGGTALTNGFFLPGTAFYDGQGFVGAPYLIPQGCDLMFVNVDPAVVTNGHQIMSIKRRNGRPLFDSPFVAGPATITVKTSHLKAGTYPYFCSVHFGMFGLIEVRATRPEP